MKLIDSRILITGGSLGIGKATAKLLVENGAQVGITGRDQARLERAAKETGAAPIVADVSDPEDIKRTYEQFLDKFSGLDALINNAAFGRMMPLTEIDTDLFRKMWETNVLGCALMAKEAAKIFIAQKSGNIVNIASTAALKGYEGGTMYASTKFGLRGMSECWRAELRKYNVRVVCIEPSQVITAFGTTDGVERPEQSNKLRSKEIAYAIKAVLEMDDRGFIPEVPVFATNPW